DVIDCCGTRTGRSYRLLDYAGAPDAERIMIVMGSAVGPVEETVEWLNTHGEKVGLLKVRLFRPFAVQEFIDALPRTTRAVAVLDRTKEPGSVGEPLYLDVVASLAEGGRNARVIGGRYGLSSKEFTPAMAKAAFDELQSATPRNHFTIGIRDDVTHNSLEYDPRFSTARPDT